MTYSSECDLERKTTNRAASNWSPRSWSHGCRLTYLPAEGQEVLVRISLQSNYGPMGIVGITVGIPDALGYENAKTPVRYREDL